MLGKYHLSRTPFVSKSFCFTWRLFLQLRRHVGLRAKQVNDYFGAVGDAGIVGAQASITGVSNATLTGGEANSYCGSGGISVCSCGAGAAAAAAARAVASPHFLANWMIAFLQACSTVGSVAQKNILW